MSFSNDFCCMICNLKLNKICIYCVECASNAVSEEVPPTPTPTSRLEHYLCLECFSHGAEHRSHRRTHAYKVVNLEAILTFDGWTVYDEMRLVGALEENKCNLNELVGKLNARRDAEHPHRPARNSVESALGALSAAGIVRHYERWFRIMQRAPHSDKELFYKRALLRSTGVSLLNESNSASANDLLSSTGGSAGGGGTLWHAFPARPPLLSAHFRLMNGYRPARADFETEYEDKFEPKYVAEMDAESWASSALFADETAVSQASSLDLEATEPDELSDSTIEALLKVQVLRSYRDVIHERYNRKSLIRRLGMLNELALSSTYQNASANFSLSLINNRQYQLESSMLLPPKYSDSPSASFDLVQRDNFFNLKNNQFTNWTQMLRIPVKFQRLFESADELVKFNEIVCYHHQLRKRLDDLKEYRSSGLSSLRHVAAYANMKLKRLNRQPSVHLSSLLTTITNQRHHDESSRSFQMQQHVNREQCREWFKRFVILEKNLVDTSNPVAAQSALAASSHTVRALKNQQNPLKIENYPDVEKLDEDEKELCRVARIRPTVYLRVKAILLLENSKAGFCNYSRARKIAGIDVNKTRVIHTFMTNHNHIKCQSADD